MYNPLLDRSSSLNEGGQVEAGRRPAGGQKTILPQNGKVCRPFTALRLLFVQIQMSKERNALKDSREWQN
jgi:hypothetical protein